MAESLRKIFSSFIYFQDIPANETEHYDWFRTAEHELIGIAKSELTARDHQLLSAFCSHTMPIYQK